MFSNQRVTIMARVKDLRRHLLIEMCRQEVETALATKVSSFADANAVEPCPGRNE